MTDHIDTMKQALEALCELEHDTFHPAKVFKHKPAITALRLAIEQAEKQEPFGYFQYAMHFDAWVQNRDSNKGVAFYTTAQPQREWVGLTKAEHTQIAVDAGCMSADWLDFACAIEAKLKKKNTEQE